MPKTFLKWAGGKGTLLEQIIPRIPPFNNYFEPFIGGGAVFFNLVPQKAHLNDINEELINCYTVVRDNVEELIGYLAEHKNEEEYYYQVREWDREDSYSEASSVERASRFIFLNKTDFNGLHRVNAKGHFNVPFGFRKAPKICDEETLRTCSISLQQAHLTSGSFVDLLSNINTGDFVYLDPPYLPLESKTNFTAYAKEAFGLEEHLQLKEFCVSLIEKNANFLLSNSSASAIYEIYSDPIFKIEEILAKRNINCDGKGRGKVTELLISNRKE